MLDVRVVFFAEAFAEIHQVLIAQSEKPGTSGNGDHMVMVVVMVMVVMVMTEVTCDE